MKNTYLPIIWTDKEIISFNVKVAYGMIDSV